MIFSKIPFRIWERVIRIGSIIFFTTSIISPFLGLTFYLFESDLESFLAEKHERNKKTKKKIAEKKHISQKSIFDAPTTPFIPAPNIEEFLTFSYHNTRPGQSNNSYRELHLDTEKKSVTCKENETVFLLCKSDGSIEFTDQKTPFSITSTIHSKNELSLDYTVTYENKEEEKIFSSTRKVQLKKQPAKNFSLSRSSKKAIKQLHRCTFLKEDKLITLFGGKEYNLKKGKHRLLFPKNTNDPIVHIQENDILCFVNDHFEKCDKSCVDKPVFQIKSISNDSIEGRFWNENGFYEQGLSILPYPMKDNEELSENIFEEIYKGKGGIVYCKIAGKIHVLCPGDWLCKCRNTWRVLQSKAELEKILTFQNPMKILIYKDVVKKDSNKYFYGFLFNETRTSSKKLEIPLKKKRNL